MLNASTLGGVGVLSSNNAGIRTYYAGKYIKIPVDGAQDMGLFMVNADAVPYNMYYFSVVYNPANQTFSEPKVKAIAKIGSVGTIDGKFEYSPTQKALYYSQTYGGGTAIAVYMVYVKSISLINSGELPSDVVTITLTT